MKRRARLRTGWIRYQHNSLKFSTRVLSAKVENYNTIEWTVFSHMMAQLRKAAVSP